MTTQTQTKKQIRIIDVPSEAPKAAPKAEAKAEKAPSKKAQEKAASARRAALTLAQGEAGVKAAQAPKAEPKPPKAEEKASKAEAKEPKAPKAKAAPKAEEKKSGRGPCEVEGCHRRSRSSGGKCQVHYFEAREKREKAEVKGAIKAVKASGAPRLLKLKGAPVDERTLDLISAALHMNPEKLQGALEAAIREAARGEQA